MSCENHAEQNRKHEEAQRQIDTLAARVTALEIINAGLLEKVKQIFSMLEKIEVILEKLTSIAAKRWETLIAAIISAGIGAAMAFIIMGG